MALQEVIAEASFAFILDVRKMGMEIAANVATIAMTIIISTKVNAL
jgi:hypothetical protein